MTSSTKINEYTNYNTKEVDIVDDRLNELLRVRKKYANNNSYIFKVCSDSLSKDTSIKWLVVMKEMNKSETNDNPFNDCRSIISANNIKIINIININKPKLTKSFIVNKNYMCECCNTIIGLKDTRYETGQILTMPEHDNDNSINELDEICCGGIKCFKSIKTAYYTSDRPKDFNGFWTHDILGISRTEGFYIEGLKTGTWKKISLTGDVESTCEYVNGKMNGYCKMLYHHGWADGFFKDDKKNGLWTYRSMSQIKLSEGEYTDDEKSGYWTFWNDDGTKLSEGNYCKNEKSGRWTTWHSNDKKESEGEYLSGKKTGFWQNWYWNGAKSSEGFYTNGLETGVWKRYNF